MSSRFSTRPAVLAVLLGLGITTSALAGTPLGVFSIPVTGHGDSIEGSAGAPVALTPTSFLVGTEGPDGAETSADDLVVLVTDVDTVPVLTPLNVPFMSDFSGHMSRLSTTRVATVTAGPDDTWATADDRFVLLDRLGTDNLIIPVTLGGLEDRDPFFPAALTADSAVVRTLGPDNQRRTADDELVLLTDLGGANTITRLSAPFMNHRGQSAPVVLSPTSLVAVSAGPDGTVRTADDGLHVFTGLGSTNTRTTVPLPFTLEFAGGQPTRVTSSSVLVAGAGPDVTDGSADDVLHLISGLGAANTVTPIAVPHIMRFGGGRPTVLSETVAAIGTEGPDSAQENADDTVAIVTGLGTTNTVAHVALGGLNDDAASAPQRLSATSLALASGGPNFAMPSADDEVIVVSGVGTTNTVTRIPLSGLDEGSVSRPTAFGSSGLLIGSGGPDGNPGSGGDDLLSLVTGLPSTPLVLSLPALNELDSFCLSCAPHPLGEGRAVAFSSGPNNDAGTGNDDLLRVMTGLPQPLGLIVQSVNLKFSLANPTAKQNMDAKGTLLLEDPALLEGEDLIVSLGNIAQRVPADLIRKKKNGILEYSDPNGARGFLKKLTLNTKKGSFSIQGKGTETGIETTSPGYIPVALQAGDAYLSDLVAGVGSNKGIKFKR